MLRTACCLMLVLTSLASAQETREEKVLGDRKRVLSEGFWIYNDLESGFDQARRTGKPLLVVLRCIPCEECVKLDDDLVDQDPVIRPLLDKFVCVRQVSTNGLDLQTFQYDTDQSFAVFMLNGDGTIYGRFGTRSHRTEWFGDVSLVGLAKALEGALELHEAYPGNKKALAGKRGPQPEFSSPEQYPALKDKFTDSLDYSGNVVRSCIHCHQIGDAQRALYRERGEPIPDRVLYPYPHPKSIGLVLDPDQRAGVKDVLTGSLAAAAGFREGDHIKTMNDQPLLSIADVQWVLHGVSPEGGEVTAVVERNGAERELTLQLPEGWRLAGDISWRVSSWGLRRMALGGLVLEELPAAQRAEAGVQAGKMALLVKRAGRYGPHAAARQAGFREGDVIVEFDGHTGLLSEADVLRYGVQERKAGERVPVKVLREGRTVQLMLPMQK